MICLMPFEAGDELITLWCFDTYHKDCILQWGKKNTTCPHCQSEAFVI